MMRGAPVAISVLFAASSFGAAQQQMDATFKATAELVLVPASVTLDRHPVHNLKQNDFTVFQDGKPQKISVFDEIDEGINPTEDVPEEPQTIRNYRFSRLAPTIILLDFLDMTPYGWEDINKQFADVVRVIIETKTPVEVLALSWNGLIEIMPVSGNPNELLDAAVRWKEMKNRQVEAGASRMLKTSAADGMAKLLEVYGVTSDHAPSDVIDKRTQIFDEESMVFAALEEIAQAYKGQRGRKNLIWITTNVPTFFKQARGPQVLSDKLKPKELMTLKALTNANVSLYPAVGANAVIAGFIEGGYDACAHYIEPRFYVVDQTGGSVCVDATQDCVRKIVTDAKGYYLLGFYLRDQTKPGWHKLKVEVSDSKLQVRSKQAFIVGYEPGPSILDSDEKFIEAAIKAPLPYTALPLSLHWNATGADYEDRKLDLIVRTPPDAVKAEGEPARLNLKVVIYVNGDEDGQSYRYDNNVSKEVSPKEQAELRSAGFLYRTSITLPEGHYQLKFLMRDNSTALTGTISAAVDLSGRKRLPLPQ